MDIKIINNVLNGFLGCQIDGVNNLASGFHIDYIDETLDEINRSIWYEKACEFLPIVQILREQLGISWDLILVIYLKDRRKKIYRNFNFKSLEDLKTELDIWTPPEFCILAWTWKKESNYKKLSSNKYNFLPNNTETFFCEFFDKESRSYRRSIKIHMTKKQIFKLMVQALYDEYNLNEKTNITKIHKERLEKLEQKILDDPNNDKLLVELGALSMVAFDDGEKAKQYVKKAIKINDKNFEAKFWLALCTYYFLDNINESIEILNESLKINPKQPECLMLLYRFTWEKTKIQSSGFSYLKKAAEYASEWIAPKIWLSFYFYNNDSLDAFKKEVNDIIKLESDIQTYTDIIDKFKATYLYGNTKENLNLIYALKTI